MYRHALISSVIVATVTVHAQYTATYLPSNAPAQTEQGQAGTNKCGGGSDQNSMCQNAYINSVDDFCLWAPPSPGPDSTIGETEREEVAWCMKSGYGTRLIPDGTISGAHFVQTPDYVQITGVGDLTKINIAKTSDDGGELDPHGADGNGNPIGGLVFSSAFGQLQQLHEWTNFMGDSQFCFRACKEGGNGPALCNHVYDTLGCDWNMPANYDPNVFENCKGDTGEPMGVYGGSTFSQGFPVTPDAHPAPSSSMCTPTATIGNGAAVAAPSSGSTGTGSTTGSAQTSPATGGTKSGTGTTSKPTTGTSSKTSSSASGSPTKSSGALAMTAPVVWTRSGIAVVFALVGAVFGAALI
ncbi:hypothetical protein BD410DRAFT_581157 [Rickenella mellea]|uniref:Macrofage activating glyco protein n=1 Tax=Rickenella mellea TaxID=50990 RepID=A0A4Y7PQ50_9AGAM|nr:hypothetical protein BD410DRAFT_581157 [Rickenella mellea]